MARKSVSWDYDCPNYVDFRNVAENSESEYESYFDRDHEASPSSLSAMSSCRTPLAELQYAGNERPVASSIWRTPFSELHRNMQKLKISCTPLPLVIPEGEQKHLVQSAKRSLKLSKTPCHDYDLRNTPSRLSRLHMQRYLEACSVTSTSAVSEEKVKAELDTAPQASTTHLEDNEESTNENMAKDENNEVFISEGLFPITSKRHSTPKSSSMDNHSVKKKICFSLQTSDEEFIPKMEDTKLNPYEPSKGAVPKIRTQKKRVTIASQPVKKMFGFKTDKYRRSQPALSSTTAKKELDFVHTLRRISPRISAAAIKATVPLPFDLKTNKRMRDEHYGRLKGNTPMAEKIAAFLERVPQRFHTVRHGTVFQPSKTSNSHTLVRPQTPNLLAVKRHRPVYALSKSQQEIKEAEEVKKFKFHAQPFNSELLLNPPKLPKVDVKPVTQPKSFHLQTDKRIVARQQSVKSKDDNKYEFHARDVPKSILKGPVGIKEKPHIPVTMPITPAFALAERQHKWKTVDTSTDEVFQFKAKPAPVLKTPLEIRHSKKMTSPVPFTFYEKDKQRFSEKEAKMNELRNESEGFTFHAQPVPASIFSANKTVILDKKPVVKVKPFNFKSDQIMQQRAQKEKEKLAEKQEKLKKMLVFKAHEPTVLKKKPFVPQKPAKSPTRLAKFQLNTEKRAAEWAKLQSQRKSMEAELQTATMQIQKQKEKEEKAKLQQMRKERVIKANAVRNYKAIQIQPSKKPLTKPRSPRFATKDRFNKKTSPK